MKCRNCRFIDYFTSEAMYWCHQKRDYVNPESSICEKFKPKMKGPLDKKEYRIAVDFLTEPKAAKNVEEGKQLIESGFEYVTDMEGIKLFRKRK